MKMFMGVWNVRLPYKAVSKDRWDEEFWREFGSNVFRSVQQFWTGYSVDVCGHSNKNISPKQYLDSFLDNYQATFML